MNLNTPATVILLAAGEGKRLRPLTNDIPKALLEVNGQILIDRIADAFAAIGLNDFVVVTGHGEKKLWDHVTAARPTYRWSYVQNEHWKTTNNAYSLLMALCLPKLEGDLYIVNTDILFEPSILKSLKDASESTLLIDSTKKLTDESMKVQLEFDRVTQIKKDMSSLLIYSVGEYIGITKIIEADRRKLKIALDAVVGMDESSAFYEDALQFLASWTPVRVQSIGTLKWTEIDTMQDYEYAKDLLTRGLV